MESVRYGLVFDIRGDVILRTLNKIFPHHFLFYTCTHTGFFHELLNQWKSIYSIPVEIPVYSQHNSLVPKHTSGGNNKCSVLIMGYV
jgi:hypothetical protein